MEEQTVRSKILDTFKSLRKMGFLARANFCDCQSCAGYELTTMAEKRIEKGQEVKGCVYWHQQDEDHYQRDGKLYLAFGQLDSYKKGLIGLPTIEIGKIVVSELKKRGLSVEWDGSPGTRILVE